jgi:hypothetical protein
MNNNELIDAMVQRLGQEVKGICARVQQGQVYVGAIEVLVRQHLWQFGGQAVAVLLESLDKHLTGDRAVHDRRTRTIMTLFGPVDITRGRCQDGRYPLDEALGLVGQEGWTAGVQEAVSLLGCECSFETVSDLMQRLLGLSISGPSVERVAEQAGQRAVEQAARAGPRPVDSAVGKTLVMAVDGCQAPQRDGWHEVKVGTVYVNESRAKKASGRGRVGQKEYLATLESAEGFGQQLWRCAQGWGVDRARRVVCMGDGAPWIWNLAAEHFPGAVEIVDYYHAMEHLWAVGEALWGDRSRSERTRGWVRHYRKLLRRGRVDLVMEAIRRGQARMGSGVCHERREIVRRNLEYFRVNAGRMVYARYRRVGLPIGTGMVEGSCKFVVQSRFKRPGSRWSAQGLAKMLALKVIRLNERWESLWPCLKAA